MPKLKLWLLILAGRLATEARKPRSVDILREQVTGPARFPACGQAITRLGAFQNTVLYFDCPEPYEVIMSEFTVHLRSKARLPVLTKKPSGGAGWNVPCVTQLPPQGRVVWRVSNRVFYESPPDVPFSQVTIGVKPFRFNWQASRTTSA